MDRPASAQHMHFCGVFEYALKLELKGARDMF